MLIQLSNDFHMTETRVRLPNDSTEVFLSMEQVRRIEKRLCGNKGCCCSGYLGIRGRQNPIDMGDFWAHLEYEHGFVNGVEGMTLYVVAD